MRLVSIDILRTIAIVLMVLVHFMENLAGADWAPAGFGAPLFTFLVGISYRIWLDSQEAKGRNDRDISRTTIRRGLFLFALGFIFNVVVWLPDDIFNWDVLTLIGVSFFLLNLARTVPPSIPVMVCIVSFIMAPILRSITDYPAYWEHGYFECDFTVSDVLIGLLATGYFPIFPWILYPLAGFVTASILLRDPTEPRPSVLGTAICGALLIGISVAAQLLRPMMPTEISSNVLIGWSMFPPTMEYVTGTLGMALLAFSLGHQFIDRNPRLANHRTLQLASGTLSRHSLSIYLVHHVVHLWPMWIYALIKGEEPTHYWRQAMPVSLAIVWAIVFLVACFTICRWMDRKGYQGIEAVMRRICG